MTIDGESPTIFKHLPVQAQASSLADGVMGFGHAPDATVVNDRRHWLKSLGIKLDDTTLVRIAYDETTDYRRITTVTDADRGKGMADLHNPVVADALFTEEPAHALFLPLADCGGVVLYDSRTRVLGLAHLGRHATMAGLAKQLIAYMRQRFNSNPSDISIWIGPAIGGDSYMLHTFALEDEPEWQPYIKRKNDGIYVDLQAYNVEQFTSAGVPNAQIECTNVDTATHPAYPSHYRYRTHGERQKAGRFAIVARMSK